MFLPSRCCAGRHHYYPVKKMLPRLCTPVPHLRRPQPVQKASDGPPRPPEEVLAGQPEDFKDITNAEWRLAMQATMRVKVCCGDWPIIIACAVGTLNLIPS